MADIDVANGDSATGEKDKGEFIANKIATAAKARSQAMKERNSSGEPN